MYLYICLFLFHFSQVERKDLASDSFTHLVISCTFFFLIFPCSLFECIYSTIHNNCRAELEKMSSENTNRQVRLNPGVLLTNISLKVNWFYLLFSHKSIHTPILTVLILTQAELSSRNSNNSVNIIHTIVIFHLLNTR